MNEKSYKPLEPVAGLQFLRNTELGVLKALQNNRYKITPIDTLHRHDCDLYERWFPKTIDSLIPLGLVRKRYFSSGEYTTTVEGNKKAIEGIFFYLNQINSFGGLSMSERSASDSITRATALAVLSLLNGNQAMSTNFACGASKTPLMGRVRNGEAG